VIFPPWTQLYLHAGHTQACGTLLQPATGRLISTNSTEQVELTTDTMRLPVKGVLYWVRAADHEKVGAAGFRSLVRSNMHCLLRH
jgi:hypothetical protein